MMKKTAMVTVRGHNGLEFPVTEEHYAKYKRVLTLVAEKPKKLIAAPPVKPLITTEAKPKTKRKAKTKE